MYIKIYEKIHTNLKQQGQITQKINVNKPICLYEGNHKYLMAMIDSKVNQNKANLVLVVGFNVVVGLLLLVVVVMMLIHYSTL